MKKNVFFRAINTVGFAANAYAVCMRHDPVQSAFARTGSFLCNALSYLMLTHHTRPRMQTGEDGKEKFVRQGMKFTLHRVTVLYAAFQDMTLGSMPMTDLPNGDLSPFMVPTGASAALQLTHLYAGIDPENSIVKLRKPSVD